MSGTSVIHNTFVIEKHYPASPHKVYAAFADKAKKRRWCVEGEGFTIDRFDMDFRVGGLESSQFRFKDGPPITMDAIYQDLVPDERIVFVYTMALAGKRMSTSLTTIQLTLKENGTALTFTEQGAFFDGVDNIQGREEGTRQLLEQLAKEVTQHV